MRKPDEITEDAIRTRAKALLVKNGWKPGDRINIHSAIELLTSFGLAIQKEPEQARCAYPECGCDFDAICDGAIPREGK